MYDFLEGQIAGRSAVRLVLDVQGVGYELLVPPGASFPSAGRLRLWTHLVVREDSHQLYGFRDERSREVFRALLGVTGVGPKVALALLAGLPCDEIVHAIASGDSKPLTRARGVGQRIADQILLDLRGKLAQLTSGAEGSAAPAAARGPAHVEDAVAALISIGYSDKEARKQVERAAKTTDPADLELLVRTALQG